MRTDKDSYKITYDKKDFTSWAGVYLFISGDISNYNALSFLVKGEKGKEKFEIGLKDFEAFYNELDATIAGPVSRYLPNGITTEWQVVIIPLDHFPNLDLANTVSLILLFNELGNGKFWLDEVQFLNFGTL